MLVTFVAEDGIDFLGLDLLNNGLQFVDFDLEFVAFSLDGLHLGGEEAGLILVPELLNLPGLDLGLDSAAGSLQLKEVGS